MGGQRRDVRRAGAALTLAVSALVAGGPAGAAAFARISGPPIIVSVQLGPPQPTDEVVFLSVNPDGLATNVVVEYGPTSAYGAATPPTSPGTSAAAPSSLSITISNLRPKTTYHARVVATNAAGSTDSSPLTFTTAAPASAPPPTVPTSGGVTMQRVSTQAAGGYGGLSGVACAGPSCLAVGYQGVAGAVRPLVERWTGASWVVSPGPTSPGASLYAIACPTATDCLAVGRDGSDVYSAQLVGRAWRVLPTPSPPSPNGDLLRSITCLSPQDCLAAGTLDGASTAMHGLLEQWNGRAWRVVADPTPVGTLFNAVTCSAPQTCWIVGATGAYPGVGRFYAQRSSGPSWVRVGPLTPGELNDVWCERAGGCWVTGGGLRSSVLLHVVGNTWRVTPNPPSVVGPIAGACTSGGSCWAVGYAGAQHWNGQTWTTATGSGGITFSLLAATCPTATCLAVGTSGTNALTANRPAAAVLRVAG